MSKVLERETLQRQTTDYRVPVRRRNPTADLMWLAVGALVALGGMYFQFAPSGWWLAHFSEAYHLASYTLSGVILAIGFGLYADRTYEEDGRSSARTIAGVALQVGAAIGAVIAVVMYTG